MYLFKCDRRGTQYNPGLKHSNLILVNCDYMRKYSQWITSAMSNVDTSRQLTLKAHVKQSPGCYIVINLLSRPTELSESLSCNVCKSSADSLGMVALLPSPSSPHHHHRQSKKNNDPPQKKVFPKFAYRLLCCYPHRWKDLAFPKCMNLSKPLANIFNRPGVAGAVLQSPPSIIDWLIEWLSDPLVKISSKHSQSQTGRARVLKFWENVHPTLYFMCHMSPVNCHVSCVTYHMYFLSFKKIGQRGGASQWRVCYQHGLPCLVI